MQQNSAQLLVQRLVQLEACWDAHEPLDLPANHIDVQGIANVMRRGEYPAALFRRSRVEHEQRAQRQPGEPVEDGGAHRVEERHVLDAERR